MSVAATARSARRRRREDVRVDLVRALEELIEDGSLRDVTIDEIARRAGLSRSAFYFYFRDKHDLLMTATAAVADELYREADRWWHGQGEPETLVREALGGVTSLYAGHRRLLAAAIEVSTYDAELGAFWRALVGRFVDATASHLERERDAGRLAAVEPRAAAEALVWMVERCLWLFLAQGERSVDDVVDQLAAVWVAALYGRSAA